MMFMCNRGRENLRNMTLGDFVVDTYVGGRRYVVYVKNIVTKITRKMWVTLTMVVGGYMKNQVRLKSYTVLGLNDTHFFPY